MAIFRADNNNIHLFYTGIQRDGDFSSIGQFYPEDDNSLQISFNNNNNNKKTLKCQLETF